MAKPELSRLLVSVAAALLACVLLALTARQEPAEAAFPGRNGKIFFAEDYDGIRMAPTASKATTVKRVPSTRAYEIDPAVSPDGKRIAYAQRDPRTGGRDLEVYVLALSNGTVRKVTNNRVYDGNPAWAPDGTRLVFERQRPTSNGTDFDLFVGRADGTGATTNVTTNPAEDDLAPAWSPGGKAIAFHGDTTKDIYVLNLDTGQTRPITTDGTTSRDRRPNWSPDGRRLAFDSFSSPCDFCGYTNAIYTVDSLDGSDRRQLASGSGEDFDGTTVTYPTYSPDGERIAYIDGYHSSSGLGIDQLYTMSSSDGSAKKRVYDPTGEDYLYAPDWGDVVRR